MTTVPMNASDSTQHGFDPSTESTQAPRAVSTMSRILWDDLPSDVRDCEVTIIALFRASQMLNFLTGGRPEMTFSARTWHASQTTRWLPARAGWIAMGAGVDLACRVLRGETAHCATAWSNYIARRPTPRTR